MRKTTKAKKKTYPRSKTESWENWVTVPEPWAWNPEVPANCKGLHRTRRYQTGALALVWVGAGGGQGSSSTDRGGAERSPARTPPITGCPRARPLDMANQRIHPQSRERGECFGKWTSEPAQAVLSQVPCCPEGPQLSLLQNGQQTPTKHRAASGSSSKG